MGRTFEQLSPDGWSTTAAMCVSRRDRTLESIASVRRFVGSELRDLPRPIRENALLLSSELVTNAAMHAQTSYCVIVRRDASALRISVIDRSTSRPQVRHPLPSECHGRGLSLVEMLSDEWGVTPLTRGKSVWFVIERRW